MMNVLKVSEIVDLGIEKEKKRRDFYDQVASCFEDAELKALFSQLSDWEENHVRKFSGIRNSLNSVKPVESYEGEFSAYMSTLVDDFLYKEVSADAFGEHVKSPVEAINYSIGFEKDAILFFMELSKYVQSEHKEVIDQLIGEERQHAVSLLKMREKYKTE